MSISGITQSLCATWARDTIYLVRPDPQIPKAAPQFSYEDVEAFLIRQRELIAERIERGR